MKKYIISFVLLLVFLYVSFYTFNFIDAWLGILFGVLTIGGYLYYIYKQLIKLTQ